MHPALNIAIKAARRAGQVINRASNDLDLIKVASKQPNDFVTEVDKAAEAAIIETLQDAYPGYGILAEESGQISGKGKQEEEYQWIIDPLDGTTNFIHGLPVYCVSIALAFRGLHGEDLIVRMFEWLPGGVNSDIWFMMALIFVLGFFIEWIEISYIAVPLFLPVLINQGVDPVWLAMLITVNLQSSFLTPPFGWALFYLKGVAPPEVGIRDIYAGVVPFIAMLELARTVP